MIFDFDQAVIEQMITHHVGNKQREEHYVLNENVAALEEETKEHLLTYFLSAMKREEVYSFTHAVDWRQNDILKIVEELFNDPSLLVQHSQNVAKLLYEASMHPKINEGELSVVYFNNIIVGDEMVEAIGIFKSETQVPFIKMNRVIDGIDVGHEFGCELKGLDKGCLIFNLEENDAYRCLVVDPKSADAQYWKDDFLKIMPIANEFYLTNQFLSMTKDFVTKKMPEDYEMDKTEKIDLLNRSVDYFKDRNNFDKEEFIAEVFVDEEVQGAFKSYNNTYDNDHNVETRDSFFISEQAVKKQSRVFKSVLKLDKNFSVYIHGDKELIQQGVEPDGRKFYKIYFKEEN